MLPVIVIIGRPNVGKSTLFNALTRSRDALVADFPGVTRDRQYAEATVDDKLYIVVDTGGVAEFNDPTLAKLTEDQVQQAIQEADVLLFMVDAKAGLTNGDMEIAERLRKHTQKVVLVVNKVDGKDQTIVSSEFYQLGFSELHSISATHRQGIHTMMTQVLNRFAKVEAMPIKEEGIRIAIIGRPNVGKSTLVNRLLGKKRVVVIDRPGTTRDSIYIPFERRGENYMLIDTAGMRRRSKVTTSIEKISVIKTMQAMEKSHVVIVMLDAREGVTEQDLRLIGLVIKMGKALIIAINKWDGMNEYDRNQVKQTLDRRLSFVDFARRYFISALHGTGVGKLFYAIHEAYQSAQQALSTANLTKVLEKAVVEHQPPLIKGRRIRLRYAHLGNHDPLTIVVHGKQTDRIPISYRRYLGNYFRGAFNLVGVPLILYFKSDVNPYMNGTL